MQRTAPARGIDRADEDADGLIAWVQFGQQASGRHCRHRDDAQSEGSVEPLGQHLRFRLADLAGGEELAPNIAALDGIAVDEGQGQRGPPARRGARLRPRQQ